MPAWRSPVELRLEARDGHRWLAIAALGGLAAGGAMAIFGLPPVDIHGPLHYLGVMGPGCGGTRSVWAAMQGDLGMSLRYNPIGIPLVVGAGLTLLRLAVGTATGRWLNLHVRSLLPVALTAGVLIALLAVNQQRNVELLRTTEEFSPVGPLLNALPILGLSAVLFIRGRRMARRSGRGDGSPAV